MAVITSTIGAYATVTTGVARGGAIVAGAQVTVAQLLPTDPVGSATLTFVGLPVGTDIVVLQAGTSTVLLQVDAHPSTSYDYAFSVYLLDTVVDVGFIKTGYEVQYVRNLTLPRSNSLLPIALRPDRNFI